MIHLTQFSRCETETGFLAALFAFGGLTDCNYWYTYSHGSRGETGGAFFAVGDEGSFSNLSVYPRSGWESTWWACRPRAGSSSIKSVYLCGHHCLKNRKLCESDCVAAILRQTCNGVINLRWWVMQINSSVHCIAARGADSICPSWDSGSEPVISLPSRCVETCKDWARNRVENP